MATPDPTKSHAPGRAAELGLATWPEVAGEPGLLLVPVGSCEQHGPHLPLDTDTRIALAVARGVAAVLDEVWIAPPVSYGSSGEHQSFAGTLSIGTAALTTLLVELGRSALPADGAGWARVVFVNGHGGNLEAVRGAVRILVGEGRAVSSWSPTIPRGDAHAGRTETSLLLAVDAAVVRDQRPVGVTDPVETLLPGLRRGGVGAVSANGVLGDASGASTEEGRALLEELVADLAGLLGAS